MAKRERLVLQSIALLRAYALEHMLALGATSFLLYQLALNCCVLRQHFFEEVEPADRPMSPLLQLLLLVRRQEHVHAASQWAQLPTDAGHFPMESSEAAFWALVEAALQSCEF